VSYVITDNHGVETVRTQADLFDALIMRGVPAVEALLVIAQLVLAVWLDAQEVP
jgi:hypothetical protein